MSYVTQGPLVGGFFGFFIELIIVMRAIVVRITWVFSKAHLNMERKTFSLLATRIALVFGCP